MFVASVRHYLGAYLLLLDGADAIVFTGGIGENSSRMREAVCADLDWFGIRLDRQKNATAKGEMAIHATDSRVQLWIMPTNEELDRRSAGEGSLGEVRSCSWPESPAWWWRRRRSPR